MYGNNSYGSAPYSSKPTLFNQSSSCGLLQRFPLMPSPLSYGLWYAVSIQSGRSYVLGEGWRCT